VKYLWGVVVVLSVLVGIGWLRTVESQTPPGYSESDMASVEDRLDRLEQVFRLGGIGAPSALEQQTSLERLTHLIGLLLDNDAVGSVLTGPMQGTLYFGSVPAIIDASGIHFKDEAFGDGIFWDANSAWTGKLRGYSSDTEGFMQLAAEDADSGTGVPYAAVEVKASTISYAGLSVDIDGSSLREAVLRDERFAIEGVPLALVDSITAPGAQAGYALIYVDSADGDLKVKFGDGFVAVLAADS
jgi:hypothetical protein